MKNDNGGRGRRRRQQRQRRQRKQRERRVDDINSNDRTSTSTASTSNVLATTFSFTSSAAHNMIAAILFALQNYDPVQRHYYDAFTFAHYASQHQHQYQHMNMGMDMDIPPFSFLHDRLVPFIKRILHFVMLITAMLCTSIGTYIVLYKLIVPDNFISRPIFFDYNYQHCNNQHLNQNEQNQAHANAHANEPLYSSFSSAGPPTAIVDLLSLHTQWKPHIPNIAPQSQSNAKIKTKTKPYYINIQLALPESLTNQQIGVFMVETFIKNSNYDTIASSKRPVMLPYQSFYISQWKKFIYLALYILNIKDENQFVTVHCFDHFMNGGLRDLGYGYGYDHGHGGANEGSNGYYNGFPFGASNGGSNSGTSSGSKKTNDKNMEDTISDTPCNHAQNVMRMEFLMMDTLF
eukprot:CAMPEP_0203667288 /NCGR_PEP_ID=MMETSP0090-20130426/4158_1 /ASSEMBLY_ACC=CAM_ASM_001088 /TAXON_ID=426623 /ORGANISM="Chaetoceros affinis, Strain CCMP159" /LENGTH=404 /DNA_ID=CAMNT_0050531407 /DNA_START=121 /DNA_END=1335 /DNA_ORIENTATION=+